MELYKIVESFSYLTHRNQRDLLVICVDNKSALQTLKEKNSNNSEYVRESLHLIPRQSDKELQMSRVWIPAHCEIRSNEEADENAKTLAADTTQRRPESEPHEHTLAHKPNNSYCTSGRQHTHLQKNSPLYTNSAKLGRLKLQASNEPKESHAAKPKTS